MTERNVVKCKRCGDVIESKFRHDFVQCKCGAIFTDGGKAYWRRGGEPADFDTVTEEDLAKLDLIPRG